MPGNKNSRPKHEIKVPRKKVICEKIIPQCIFCFAFLKFSKLEMFFQKQDFSIWMKGKKTWKPKIIQTGGVMTKFVLKKGEACLKEGQILHKAIYAHLHSRNFISLNLALFFCWNFTLIVARHYRHVRV